MPFGLKNAPATFQRAMQKALGKLPFCKIYIDDILIHSPSEEIHYQHIISFLEVARQMQISINFEKSKFIQPQVNYLGSIISEKGIRPDTSRLVDFQTLIPNSKKQVRKVLGFIQWFRPWLRDLSSSTKFLSDLTQKNALFHWTQENTDQLQSIFKSIEDATLLHFPNPNQPYMLYCDASDYGV